MTAVCILVVEDEAATADLVRAALEERGYSVTVAKTVLEARTRIERARPNLLVLDRNLPDKDGLEFCKELRARPETASLPILFLTARKDVSERIVGLKLGGDDYLGKPFDLAELAARVEALLRRQPRQPSPARLEFDGLSMNLDGRTVRLGPKDIALTNREYDVLGVFLEQPDRLLTRATLLARVWGYELGTDVTSKAVDVVVQSLRKKLGHWGARLEAVPGYGYRLNTGP